MSQAGDSNELERSNPYMPPGPQPVVFEDFTGGLNTDAPRPASEEHQMAWCDGGMAIGKGNLRILPGIGGALYDGGAPGTVTYYQFANIGSTPICVVFRFYRL